MTLKVILWDRTVGYLNWDSNRNAATFSYDEEFLDSNLQISPINLPLNKRIYVFPGLPFETYKGLPGVFADSLPDRFGEGLMNEYFKNSKVAFADLTPLDRLAYIGSRGMGALQYHPAREFNQKRDHLSIEELEDLADFGINRAQSLQTKLSKDSEGFQEILSVGTSAGGARAKAVIAWNEKTNEIKSGQLDLGPEFSHWILKLDVAKNTDVLGDTTGYGRVEYSYFQLAKEAGIEMSECRLWEDNGRGHFMTKRFDRVDGEKRHIHTLNGMRHINYENVLSHSYNQLFETARYLKLPYPQMEQLYRRMVFNVVMRNCDDHTKNFSFMMKEDGKWSITPAYDVTYSYDAENIWVNGHMAINGKRQGITRMDLLEEGKFQGIKQCPAIIDEIITVSQSWQEVAEQNKVPEDKIKGIQSSLYQAFKNL